MDMIANWLGNTPDFAVPFALAALGLILTERAGVLSLGAEGLMLVGALAGIGAQLTYGTPGISLFLAMVAAAVVMASEVRANSRSLHNCKMTLTSWY